MNILKPINPLTKKQTNMGTISWNYKDFYVLRT